MPDASSPAVATHCPYCALQCGVVLTGTRSSIEVAGNARFPVNRGGLCLKGWSAGALLDHDERLRTPLLRGPNGDFAPAAWSTALQAAGRRITAVQAKYGRDAVAVLGGGSLTNEKAYLIGKFARLALKDPQAREHIARLWGTSEREIPGPGRRPGTFSMPSAATSVRSWSSASTRLSRPRTPVE